MNFQCLVPSFEPPRVKCDSLAEKVSLMNCLAPLQREWNKDRFSLPASKDKLSKKPVQSKPSLPIKPSTVIDLFEGNVQFETSKPAGAPVNNRTSKNSSNSAPTNNHPLSTNSSISKPLAVHKKSSRNNSFHRMMPAMLSIAVEDNSLEADDVERSSFTPSNPNVSIAKIVQKTTSDGDRTMSAKRKQPVSSNPNDDCDDDPRKKKKKATVDQLPTQAKSIPSSSSLPKKEIQSRQSRTKLSMETKPIEMEFQAQDFQNVQYFCKNAGSSPEVLEDFLSLTLSAEAIAICMIWYDLSTNHVPMNKKFCTPSSDCQYWYCTCDKHIRADHSRLERALGVVVYVPTTLSHGANDSCYFLPLRRCVEPSTSQGPEGLVLPLRCSTTLIQRTDALRQIFSATSVCKVIFNVQLCAIALSSITGMETAPQIVNISDPRVAAYLLNPEIEDFSKLDLQTMLPEYSIESNPSLAVTCDPQLISHRGRIADVIYHSKIELMGTFKLANKLVELLHARRLSAVYFRLEMPLAFQLGALEARGVAFDNAKLMSLSEQLRVQLQVVSETIYNLSGTTKEKFNIASPEQLSRVLFSKLNLIPPASIQSTSSKFISTSEETLKHIRLQHPVIEWILTFRTIFKLMHTYFDGLKPFISIHQNNHTIHAQWNQLIVRTGRLSCSKPNLQNIPTDIAFTQLPLQYQDIRVRSLFIARPGFRLVAVDYSQIEMRVLAHVSQDKELCSLFRDREGDVYKLLAFKIFQKDSVDNVTDGERSRAKVICLGCIYGMGPQAAAARLGIEVATVSRITQSFFQHFRGVLQWIRRIRQYARQHKEVRTLSGRLRLLPDIDSDQGAKRAAAERQAVNTVIQGSASDLIKSAMLLVSKAMAEYEISAEKALGDSTVVNQRSRILMQIHDELILEIPVLRMAADASGLEDNITNFSSQHLCSVISLVKKVMEQDLAHRWQLQVPLLTTIRMGVNWGNMSSWEPPCTQNDSSSLPEHCILEPKFSSESGAAIPSVLLGEDLILSGSQFCREVDNIVLPAIASELVEIVNLDMDVDEIDELPNSLLSDNDEADLFGKRPDAGSDDDAMFDPVGQKLIANQIDPSPSFAIQQIQPSNHSQRLANFISSSKTISSSATSFFDAKLQMDSENDSDDHYVAAKVMTEAPSSVLPTSAEPIVFRRRQIEEMSSMKSSKSLLVSPFYCPLTDSEDSEIT